MKIFTFRKSSEIFVANIIPLRDFCVKKKQQNIPIERDICWSNKKNKPTAVLVEAPPLVCLIIIVTVARSTAFYLAIRASVLFFRNPIRFLMFYNAVIANRNIEVFGFE